MEKLFFILSICCCKHSNALDDTAVTSKHDIVPCTIARVNNTQYLRVKHFGNGKAIASYSNAQDDTAVTSNQDIIPFKPAHVNNT